MAVKDKQLRILSLFKKLTSVTGGPLPEADRDARLKGFPTLHRDHLFSCFNAIHLKEAQHLYELLYEAADFEDFFHLCEQARQVVNSGLFVYSVSVALLHRDDCKGVTVPPIQEIFPDRFVPAETINLALKEDKKRSDDGTVVIPIQSTGNILDQEYNLVYFREDIDVNAHHWHWHIVYPATWRSEVMHKTKDRKGELFYYMHQQMCARYDCERLSTGLQRMKPFQNFEEELEGYSAHLTSLITGLNYGSRPEGLTMKDIPQVDVQDMIRWRERVLGAIHVGHVHDENNKEIFLDEEHGIDILGALLESSEDSKNKRFNGALHNWGHVILARVHDPDGRHKEAPGVMDDTSTALRDPIFYRFHRFMDNIFQEYKHTLKPYDHDDLLFPGIRITNVTVKAKVQNVVNTFMKDSELELSHGINLKGSVHVKYEHIDHEPYSYHIEVLNISEETKRVAVRIFLAPKYDELGNRLVLDDQRRLFIELDNFHTEVAPGKHSIDRESSDSSVTISHVPTFNELEKGEGVSEDTSEFCSCGWPQHMLIPRGNSQGMKFQLFVMLTDWDHDKVNDSQGPSLCVDAVSYCGAKDDKYPDKRPMGFPFDRTITARNPTLFKTPNMHFSDVTIRFKNH